MLTLTRRRPPSGEPQGDPAAADHPPIASAGHQVTATIGTKLVTAALFTALLCGPVGAAAGLAAWTRSEQPAPAPPATSEATTESTEVGEYATRAVLAWLGATQTDSTALRDLTDTTTSSTTAFSVTDPTVAAVAEVDPDVWSVTVAATVTDARGTTARRYYQVPVMHTGEAMSVLALPSLLPGPTTADTPRTDYPSAVTLTSPMGQALGQFLDAFLAGGDTEDVSRYLTPNVTLTPLDPPAFRAVDIQQIRASSEVPDAPATDQQPVRVLVDARGKVTTSQSVDLVYALTLTARDGRWEVTAIDPAPVIETSTSGDAPDLTM